NASQKTYVHPFEDQTMNTLDTFKKHMISYEPLNSVGEEERIEDTSNDPQQLIAQSDVIAEVKVRKIVDDRGIATVSYELIKEYKDILDDNYVHIHKIKIENGEQYMVL